MGTDDLTVKQQVLWALAAATDALTTDPLPRDKRDAVLLEIRAAIFRVYESHDAST
jgi:hypothetical protein